MSSHRRPGFTTKIAGAAPSRLMVKAPKATTRSESKTRRSYSGLSATIEGDVLVLRLPLFPAEARRPSTSGKSILCATTRGPKIVRQPGPDGMVPVEIDGKALRVIASAFIPAEDKPTPKE